MIAHVAQLNAAYATITGVRRPTRATKQANKQTNKRRASGRARRTPTPMDAGTVRAVLRGGPEAPGRVRRTPGRVRMGMG
jgi:hypothetical protein